MSMTLAYNYCYINLETGECLGSATFSYEIINDAYLPVPDARDEYVGKYYNRITDLWYEDSAMTIEATEINEMYHGN